MRLCAVVPTYNNSHTLRHVVEELRRYLDEVIVVDDGSDNEGRRAALELEQDGLALLVRRPENGGKGAAVADGLRRALALKYTHALQVDADGQHDLDDVPRFLDAARAHPQAFVAGTPEFDSTAPASRRIGRVITQFWAAVETGGPVITDTLCGFRVYPLEPAVSSGTVTRRMEFDNEIAVRMYWNGVEVINLPTRVRYVSKERGGVSHYDLVWDNVLMSVMHARLSTQAPFRLTRRWLRGR